MSPTAALIIDAEVSIIDTISCVTLLSGTESLADAWCWEVYLRKVVKRYRCRRTHGHPEDRWWSRSNFILFSFSFEKLASRSRRLTTPVAEIETPWPVLLLIHRCHDVPSSLYSHWIHDSACYRWSTLIAKQFHSKLLCFVDIPHFLCQSLVIFANQAYLQHRPVLSDIRWLCWVTLPHVIARLL